MILCDELSDMTTCIPKQNCAHRLLGTVCSEKVGGGGMGMTTHLKGTHPPLIYAQPSCLTSD